MRNRLRTTVGVVYVLFLICLVHYVHTLAFSDEYFKNYVEGFMTGHIEEENRVPNLESDEVIVLDINDWPESREILPELINKIMSYHPGALGVDVDLRPKDPVLDSILIATIKKYDNIVLPYDIVEGRYPFNMEYEYFPNVCYTNWGAVETSPRYLIPYDEIAGEARTAFWARLWELYANIPPGKLKSKRQFINYNLKPEIHKIDSFSSIEFLGDYLTDIVIIGAMNEKDIFPVPCDRKRDGVFLMSGVELIGTATLTIGDNELDNSFADINRGLIGFLVVLVLSVLLCLFHFSEIRWIESLREYSNLLQFLGGVVLFFIAKSLSSSMDEWWYLFSLTAILLLLAPVVADLEKLIRNKITGK